MAILLSNDDGIDAPGLAALAEALTGLDDLYVSAPATNQSCVGMGITISRDLRARRHPDGPGGVPRHSLDGTPSDAVKYGLQHVLKGEKPRLVVSGINLGPNLGRNIRSSGTVGAAFEAATAGVPALAVSVDYVVPTDWSGAQHYVRMLAEKTLALLGDGGHDPVVINLNVPAKPPEEIPGLVVARHGLGGYLDVLALRTGGETYGLEGKWAELPPGSDCDTAAFMNGYAVVTPLQFDMTHPALLDRLRQSWQRQSVS